VREGNQEELRTLAGRVAKVESEADVIRNRLHELLASRVLLPLRREDLFNILEHQDSMADRAEDIAQTLTYRDMTLPAPLMDEVDIYVAMVLRNCELAAGIMSKLDLLVEASFSGRDAVTVSRLITELAERDDEVKPAQIELTRKLLAAENRISPVEAVLWMDVIGYLASLSRNADRTGNGIRMTLQVPPEK
jgi:predicted phosphate transport protein (TIGR00153 family)